MQTPQYLTNKNLSWKAKGILAYCLREPGWRSANMLEKASLDGMGALKTGLEELKAQGYCHTNMATTYYNNGYSYTFEQYYFFEEPTTKEIFEKSLGLYFKR